MGEITFETIEVGHLYMVRQIWRWGIPVESEEQLALCDAPNSLMFLGSDEGGRAFEYEFISEVHIVEVVEDDEWDC